MDIKTKFSIGEEVFFMAGNKVKQKYINKIKIDLWSPLGFDDKGIKILYGVKIADEITYLNESSIFKTKEDLIKNL